MSVKGVDLERAGIDTSLRFFARPVKFDFACPKCDWVTHASPVSSRRIWEPRSARLQCMGCSAVYLIGIVAWQAAHGRYREPPPDQTPTVRQALQLRRNLSRFLQTRLMRGRDTNVVYDELPELEP